MTAPHIQTSQPHLLSGHCCDDHFLWALMDLVWMHLSLCSEPLSSGLGVLMMLRQGTPVGTHPAQKRGGINDRSPCPPLRGQFRGAFHQLFRRSGQDTAPGVLSNGQFSFISLYCFSLLPCSPLLSCPIAPRITFPNKQLTSSRKDGSGKTERLDALWMQNLRGKLVLGFLSSHNILP